MMPTARKPGRFSVRPGVWAALAACLAVTAVLSAWPTPDERVQSRIKALLAREAAGEAWAEPERRRELVALFAAAQRQGDERGMRELARAALRGQRFGAEEYAALAETASLDEGDWTGETPSWKRELALRARGGAAPEPATVPVTFRFRPRGRLQAPPALAGNWDARGAVADLGGWAARPMRDDGREGDARAGDGVWSLRTRLEPTRNRVLSHAVVRTAPWPEGSALGHTDFSVSSAAVVTVPFAPEPAAAPSPASGRRAFRVAVLGVDGATWHVVLPLVQRGLMPNFGRMLHEGSAATIAASGKGFPSLPNIYTAMTGMLDFRHGVGRDYFGLNTGRRSSPLWKIASDGGKTVAAVSMWSSFPPDRVRGHVVTEAFYAIEAQRDPEVVRLSLSPAVTVFAAAFGVDAVNIRRLMRMMGWLDGAISTTYPDAIGDELRREVAAPEWGRVADLFDVTRELDLQVGRTIEFLARRGTYDLLCAWISHVDNSSHQWGGFEGSLGDLSAKVRDPRVAEALAPRTAGHRELMPDSYRAADEQVGFLLGVSETVLVFSDHGMGTVPDDFISTAISVEKLVASFRRDLGLPGGHNVEFLNSEGGWVGWFDESEADVVPRLAEYLGGMLYLPQRQPMFSGVATVRSGGRTGLRFVQDQAFPIHIDAVEVRGERRSLADYFELRLVQATHKRNGVFLARGPAVLPGVRVPDPVPLTDVAPTALRLLDMPAGADMDGRAVPEVLGPGAAAERPAVRSYGSGGNGWLRLASSVRLGSIARKLVGGEAHAAPRPK